MTKTEEEESIIINRPDRSTYPQPKSVSTSGATPGQPLDVLRQYTTFHITVYVTLITVFIGASVFKKLNHWMLSWAVGWFLVAGACGGVIAASAAEYTGPAAAFFSQPHLALWWLGPWCFKPFSIVEHLAFWAGMLPISIAYVFCGRSYLAKGLGT